MECVQFGHFDRAMPFCVKSFRLSDTAGNILEQSDNNHSGRVEIVLDKAIETDSLKLEINNTHGAPAAVNAVNIF
jgi:hypothetical protein